MARKPVYKTDLGRRMAEVREHLSKERDEMAAMLGTLSASSLANYERGVNTPDANVIASYSGQLGVSLTWLLHGTGTMFMDASKAPKPPVQLDATDAEQMMTAMETMTMTAKRMMKMNMRWESDEPLPPKEITYFPVPASAGAGLTAVAEPDFQVGYDVDLLCQQAFSIGAQNLAVLRVQGDSMLPTLANDDLAVIDRRENTYAKEGSYYLLSYDGDIYIKRTRWLSDGSLSLVSENELPQYQPVIVPPSELDRLHLIGKLVGLIRSL